MADDDLARLDTVEEDAGNVWRKIVAEHRRKDPNLTTDDPWSGRSVTAEFRRLMGVEWTDAAVSELEWYLERLRNPPSPEGANGWVLSWGEHELGPDWITVLGSSRVGQAIDLRLGIIRGRPRVIGLRMDNGVEITADVLRKIKLGEVLDVLAREYASGPPQAVDLGGVKFKEREAVLQGLVEEWARVQTLFEGLEHVDSASVPTRRGVPPSDEQLHAFARRFLEEFRSRPRGAITRTASAFPMARSTAYRWLELCRERGLIPVEEDK